MKMHVRYTSKQEHWKAVLDTAKMHGLIIIKIGEVGGIIEWVGEIDGDIADISNFANELGTAGVVATASMLPPNNDVL